MTDAPLGRKTPREQTLVRLAIALVDHAASQGDVLRVTGAIAVFMRSRSHPAIGSVHWRRLANELDFLAPSASMLRIDRLLQASGFRPLCEFHPYTGGEHRTYICPDARSLFCDAYFGVMRFNHTIPGPYFSDSYTIPPTQLLLSKLAIEEDFTNNDAWDILALLTAHDVSDSSVADSIQPRQLLRAWGTGCSAWGLALTCGRNLERTRAVLQGSDSWPNRDVVIKRLDRLAGLLKGPKSFCWKTRAKFGTRFPYYSSVEPADDVPIGSLTE